MSSIQMETPLATALQLVRSAIGALDGAGAASGSSSGSALQSLQLAATLLAGLDPYLDASSSKGPPALQALIDETDSHDWAGAFRDKKVSFAVTPGWSAGGYEGSFIAMVARAIKAKRVLEVGMFTGTTTLCVADSLPRDGKLIALEIDEYFKHLAAPFFEKAGVADIIDVRVGPALESVQAMAGKEEPFDLIFIDADKTGYHDYYETIMSSGLLAKGGVLLVDNTLYKGLPFTEALGSASKEQLGHLQLNADYGRALTAFNKHVNDDARVEASVLPIRDGVTWIMHSA